MYETAGYSSGLTASLKGRRQAIDMLIGRAFLFGSCGRSKLFRGPTGAAERTRTVPAYSVQGGPVVDCTLCKEPGSSPFPDLHDLKATEPDAYHATAFTGRVKDPKPKVSAVRLQIRIVDAQPCCGAPEEHGREGCGDEDSA